MQNQGLVSIVTPSWNCASFVEETIKSMQAQSYQNWELIFQDDCSTDETKALVDQLAAQDSRIKYECNAENSGAAITRNNALKRAQGRWIAFLDSDDIWESCKLEKQIDFMTTNGYHFSYTDYAEINEQSEPTGKFVSGPRHITKAGMYAFCWPGCLTVMYDREHVGLIQIEDIKKNNDYAMWLNVIEKADCYLLDECLAKYRRGRAGSISTHGYVTLIKWHYNLFRTQSRMNPATSLLITCLNLVCGLYKKLRFVKRKQL